MAITEKIISVLRIQTTLFETLMDNHGLIFEQHTNSVIISEVKEEACPCECLVPTVSHSTVIPNLTVCLRGAAVVKDER